MAVRRLFLPTALFLLLFAACRDEKVVSYRIPKEKDPEMPAAVAGGDAAAAPGAPATDANGNTNMAATAVPTASGAGLTWTAPANWKAKPASAMRKGSFAIPGDGGVDGDLSITAFPGDVGGELANINRWRGQLSLAPLAEGDVAANVMRQTQDGLALTIVDYVGTGASSQRILGAMVPFGGATWFFKLMGPDAVVTRAKPDFMEFIKTVKAAP